MICRTKHGRVQDCRIIEVLVGHSRSRCLEKQHAEPIAEK